jgi:membrane protease YdiL (CAAX protease family)
MSTLPGQPPEEHEDSRALEPVESPEPLPPESWTGEPAEPSEAPAASAVEHTSAIPLVEDAGSVFEPQFFASYNEPAYVRPVRIPNLGHLSLFLLLLGFGWIGAGSLLLVGLHFHLFGISNLKQAMTDFHYTLGSQAIQYFVSLAGCLVVFPVIWRKGFLVGVQWRGKTAMMLKGRLISVAVFCFFAAMLNGILMPGPTDAPIDRIFRVPGAAWMLFGFGITIAPFFEELAFRGFLLPALCTAYDWTMEKLRGSPTRPVDENGHPQWSMPATVVASLLTSVPFALMHGEQTSYSLGPFLLLILISLILCWTRLATRSLAASTMVHACYNFLLFSFMLFGTDGFKHLDRM